MARGRTGIFGLILVLFWWALGDPSPGRSPLRFQVREVSSGRLLWEKALFPGERFTLIHRNSIYGSWVQERFQVHSDGSLLLTAIQSESPAVLEYYGLETSSGRWIPMSRRFPALRLLITGKGAFALEHHRKRLDLSQSLRDGTAVEIRLVPSRPSPRQG